MLASSVQARYAPADEMLHIARIFLRPQEVIPRSWRRAGRLDTLFQVDDHTSAT